MRFDDHAVSALTSTWPFDQILGRPPTWWLSGGVALSLHLARTWRHHSDIDVAVRPRPQSFAALERPAPNCPWWADAFRGWIQTSAKDCVAVGSFVAQVPHCKLPLDFNAVGLMTDAWRLASLPGLAVSWEEAILDYSGVPYLAPELALLIKSGRPRDKDHLDARSVLPLLSAGRRSRLFGWLPTSHPWLTIKSERL